MSLQAIKFDREALTLSTLDQLLIPYASKYIPIHTIADAFQVIKLMQVRGAPAIAIVGALSVVIELSHYTSGKNKGQAYYDLENFAHFKEQLIERLDYLVTSRPTAVNLGNAISEIKKIVDTTQASDVDGLFKEVYEFGCALIDDDYTNNVKLGENGKDWILRSLEQEGFSGDFSILTICNTGSLATSGYGTALGVIRSLWKHSQETSEEEHAEKKVKLSTPPIKLQRAYPLETRPYNQGARLTAYELVYEKIPATLITDSMVTYLVSTLARSPAPVKACVVGADRIVKNGDTANKIGTYQLALVCKQFGIKFLVVAPKTTIDMNTEHGDQIVVEQRPAHEMQNVSGGLVDLKTNQVMIENGVAVSGKVGVAAPGIEVWNPSFDVTPHDLIDGIVTEDGVLEKTDGAFNLAQLFQ